jgi:hypothetical protein
MQVYIDFEYTANGWKLEHGDFKHKRRAADPPRAAGRENLADASDATRPKHHVPS